MLVVAGTLLGCCMSNAALGDVLVWKGGANANWGDASRWVNSKKSGAARVPGDKDVAVVNLGRDVRILSVVSVDQIRDGNAGSATINVVDGANIAAKSTSLALAPDSQGIVNISGGELNAGSLIAASTRGSIKEKHQLR